MASDLQASLIRLAETALQPARSPAPPAPSPPRRPRLSTGRAVLLGAGLATVGRALVVARGRDMLDSARERLAARVAPAAAVVVDDDDDYDGFDDDVFDDDGVDEDEEGAVDDQDDDDEEDGGEELRDEPAARR